MNIRKTFITAILASAMVVTSFACLACEEHEAHAANLEPAAGAETKAHADHKGHTEEEKDKDDGHDHDKSHVEKTHFEVDVPTSAEDAWIMLNQSIADARAAIKSKDTKALHQKSEKISAAVSALHDDPQAVKEEGGEKLTSALDQLSKTADRFHHVAEENNFTAASEVLDILDKQQTLTQTLYPEPFQVEP